MPLNRILDAVRVLQGANKVARALVATQGPEVSQRAREAAQHAQEVFGAVITQLRQQPADVQARHDQTERGSPPFPDAGAAGDAGASQDWEHAAGMEGHAQSFTSSGRQRETHAAPPRRFDLQGASQPSAPIHPTPVLDAAHPAPSHAHPPRLDTPPSFVTNVTAPTPEERAPAVDVMDVVRAHRAAATVATATIAAAAVADRAAPRHARRPMGAASAAESLGATGTVGAAGGTQAAARAGSRKTELSLGVQAAVAEAEEVDHGSPTDVARVGAVDPRSEPHRYTGRERRVPATPFSRVLGFGSLAAGLAFGTAGEVMRRAVRGSSESDGSPVMTEANAERLVSALCRMRGAALKLGQLLSIQDESMMPKQLLTVLDRVRQSADMMPRRQLRGVLHKELGGKWQDLLSEFSDQPMAAASIGQVHRARVKPLAQLRELGVAGEQLAQFRELAGADVAVKVQYPGVAESIDSDLVNLQRLVKYSNLLPKGLYVDELVAVAKRELRLECDYILEAENTDRFRELVADDPTFRVPYVLRPLSATRVLTTEMMHGLPIDRVLSLDQSTRDDIARRLLRLTMRELFEWRFMQTDPNWGNFLYDPATDVIALLDFGAAREFPLAFVRDYMRIVTAAADRDEKTMVEASIKLGFLTGEESPAMMRAHVLAGMAVGEPFAATGPYDFRVSTMTKKVGAQGEVFLKHRLSAPPPEVYSLHRKLSGAFLACIKLGAVVDCRALLEEAQARFHAEMRRRDAGVR